ncbi:MAG: hypothetical protein JW384_03223 [Nitrosomonadaceae bacterium]|nr:hypothetical protein [Nitrosomonadaceae bacterium]
MRLSDVGVSRKGRRWIWVGKSESERVVAIGSCGNATPAKYRAMSEFCWYTNRSCFICVNDACLYAPMFTAKYTMSSVWSWDHCFNALGISESYPSAAIEELLLPFERQASSGVPPDVWNSNSELVWAVTKPPIHGWCLNKLRYRMQIDDATTDKLIGHLRRRTDFRMDCRDYDGDGISTYHSEATAARITLRYCPPVFSSRPIFLLFLFFR